MYASRLSPIRIQRNVAAESSTLIAHQRMPKPRWDETSSFQFPARFVLKSNMYFQFRRVWRKLLRVPAGLVP